MENNVLVILGMHRSGTSLTASWLERCGLKLYNKMRGGIGNEKGHFEDLDFVSFHSKVIREKLPNSKGWIITKKNVDFSWTEEERAEAKQCYEKKNSSANDWAWKDPRACLFIEEWKYAFPDMKVLVLWRECNSVVSSLKKRSKKSKEKVMKISIYRSFISWIFYNQKILNFLDKHKKDCIVINIDNLKSSNGIKLIEHINTNFGFRLEDVEIQKLIDEKMYSKTNDSMTTLISHLFKHKYQPIERELKKQSLSL